MADLPENKRDEPDKAAPEAGKDAVEKSDADKKLDASKAKLDKGLTTFEAKKKDIERRITEAKDKKADEKTMAELQKELDDLNTQVETEKKEGWEKKYEEAKATLEEARKEGALPERLQLLEASVKAIEAANDKVVEKQKDKAKADLEAKTKTAKEALEKAKAAKVPEEEIKKLEAAVKALEEEGKQFQEAIEGDQKPAEKKNMFEGFADSIKTIFEAIGKLLGSVFGIDLGLGGSTEPEESAAEDAEETPEDDKEEPKGTVWEQVKELMKEYKIEDLGDYKKNFFAVMAAIGKKMEPDTGIPWQVMAAQACLESGYGKHAPNFNLFGIKAQEGYKGKKASLWTTEEKNGKKEKVKADFRVYSSLEESMADHAKFLKENPIYAKAFKTKDPKTFLEEVKAAGYATADKYVASAWGIVEKYSSLVG